MEKKKNKEGYKCTYEFKDDPIVREGELHLTK